jgi:phosphate/sulfate permease
MNKHLTTAWRYLRIGIVLGFEVFMIVGAVAAACAAAVAIALSGQMMPAYKLVGVAAAVAVYAACMAGRRVSREAVLNIVLTDEELAEATKHPKKW